MEDKDDLKMKDENPINSICQPLWNITNLKILIIFL